MHDLLLIIFVVGLVLAYVSVLLFINLTSQGIATIRVVKLLVELWVTFALIVAVLALVASWLGPVPSGKIINELVSRLKRWNGLSDLQQVLLIAGVLISLVLFAHLFWSLRSIRKYARRRNEVDGGNNNEFSQ